MLVPLAHPGHWLAELMYVMPVLAIVIWIAIKSFLDKRADREAGAEGPATRARED